MQFSVIVFDTAPTGHTLRLLSFPSTLEKGLAKIISLKSKFSGIFQQFSGIMGGNMLGNEEMMASKLESTQKIIREVNEQFTNPVQEFSKNFLLFF
jgi:arsenite-transporting ATPase